MIRKKHLAKFFAAATMAAAILQSPSAIAHEYADLLQPPQDAQSEQISDLVSQQEAVVCQTSCQNAFLRMADMVVEMMDDDRSSKSDSAFTLADKKMASLAHKALERPAYYSERMAPDIISFDPQSGHPIITLG